MMEESHAKPVRLSNWSFLGLGLAGGILANLFGVIFYIVVGYKVVYEAEWLMGWIIFLYLYGALGLVAGPIFGLIGGLRAYRARKFRMPPQRAALLAGAAPFLLLWLIQFMDIWIESVRMRGSLF